LAALKALNNSLEFVNRNFENTQERDFIMQVVCEATSASDAEVVAASFECLVNIMTYYYDFMPYYVEQALYPVCF
jgi:importin subunit beta-1